MYQHLLVPSDHSELSLQAAGEAVRFAAAIGARISFFYAVHTPTILNYIVEASPNIDTNPSLMTTEEIRERMRELAQGQLAELLDLAKAGGVPAEACSEESEQPYLAIIRAAEQRQCDLIFMASHGRRGVGALVLGSETQKVLTHCAVPVLVWRAV
ncbi:MAG: universal stress protein [Synechococcaceae cyanobacterium]